MGAAAVLVEFFIAMILFPLSCRGFPAVLTLERAFPLSPQPDLDMLLHRDRVRHAMFNLQSSSSSSSSSSSRVTDFQLQGTSGLGLYFTRIQLGSPPRVFRVQIDTGSDILWVSCKSCLGCATPRVINTHNSYDPRSSSTANLVGCSDKRCRDRCSAPNNLCNYTLRYADKTSTSGYYVSDLLHFETLLANSEKANATAPIVFGCSTQALEFTISFLSTDGILGLGQNSLSVISQLTSQKAAPMAFSHCLRRDGDAGGGFLVLGGVVESSMVYTPVVPSQAQYNVHLQSISVNGRRVPIDPSVFATSDNGGTIIDSGTSLAYLAEKAYDPFVHAVTAAISQVAHPFLWGDYQCYSNTSSMNVFPEVKLDFEGGASLLLDPQDYTVEIILLDGSPTWCLGIHKNQGLGLTILGDIVLRNKVFVYDLAAQRIGWVNYNCYMPVVNVSTAEMVYTVDPGNEDTHTHTHSISFTVSPLWTTQLLVMELCALWL